MYWVSRLSPNVVVCLYPAQHGNRVEGVICSRYEGDQPEKTYLHHHHCNRHVGLNVEHRSEIPKDGDEKGLMVQSFIGESCHTHRRWVRWSNEAVFEGDGQSMQRTNNGIVFGLVVVEILRPCQRFWKENLGDTIGLLSESVLLWYISEAPAHQLLSQCC